MHIIVYKNKCFNVDNSSDLSRYLEKGARELTLSEIESYGMKGYEAYVCPANTVIKDDGTVKFARDKVEIERNEQRRLEILEELDRLDRLSFPNMRAVIAAQSDGREPDQADLSMLKKYEADAEDLREELKELNA